MPEENNPQKISLQEAVDSDNRTPTAEPLSQQNKGPLKSLRTYQGDVDEIISSNKVSATTIAVAEQERKQRTGFTFESQGENAARNKTLALLGGGLLMLGVITVSVVYYVGSREQVVIDQKTKALIVFSAEKPLLVASSTRNQLISAIYKEKQSFSSKVNSVLYVNTTNSDGSTAGIESVLGLIAPRMPASLVRALDTKYMFGIYSFDTNEPFIILTTNDFAESYAGMLKWESNIISDIGEIWGIPVATPAIFEDEALQNKDLRIVKDVNRNTIFLYSFIDKNTLVITSNEKIFTAITGKYLINKMAR